MESPTCEDSTSSGSAGDGSELGRIHGRAEVQYLHLWAMEVEEERETPPLTFALFATRDLRAQEEVVLGWEWDDGCVVHVLPALVAAGEGAFGGGSGEGEGEGGGEKGREFG